MIKNILLTLMVFGSFGAFAEVPEYCAKKLNGEVIDAEKGIIEFKTMKTIGRRVDVLYTGQVNALCNWNGEGQFLYLNGYIPNQDNPMKVVGTFKNGNFDKHTLFTQGNVQIRERYKNNLLQGERFFTYPNGYRCSEVFNEGVFISSNCQQQVAVPQQYSQPPPQTLQPRQSNNYEGLKNYARCIGTPGETYASCANAWQGYTPPPPKKEFETDCDIDYYYDEIRCKTREN